MSVYSNKDILAAIDDGTIVCTPFNSKNVSEASLDFTLGFNFYKQEYDDILRVYNPFDGILMWIDILKVRLRRFCMLSGVSGMVFGSFRIFRQIIRLSF
ncbi:hypothetical protein [Candidatus Minimicrobia naudis]